MRERIRQRIQYMKKELPKETIAASSPLKEPVAASSPLEEPVSFLDDSFSEESIIRTKDETSNLTISPGNDNYFFY